MMVLKFMFIMPASQTANEYFLLENNGNNFLMKDSGNNVNIKLIFIAILKLRFMLYILFFYSLISKKTEYNNILSRVSLR